VLAEELGLAGVALTLAGGGVAALALVVALSWALATVQTAVAVMAARAIRNTDGHFFILSTPPNWRVVSTKGLQPANNMHRGSPLCNLFLASGQGLERTPHFSYHQPRPTP